MVTPRRLHTRPRHILEEQGHLVLHETARSRTRGTSVRLVDPRGTGRRHRRRDRGGRNHGCGPSARREVPRRGLPLRGHPGDAGSTLAGRPVRQVVRRLAIRESPAGEPRGLAAHTRESSVRERRLRDVRDARRPGARVCRPELREAADGHVARRPGRALQRDAEHLSRAAARSRSVARRRRPAAASSLARRRSSHRLPPTRSRTGG